MYASWRKSLLLVVLTLAGGASAHAADIEGLWLTDDGLGAVEIRPCGTARCGRIAWLKSERTPDGGPMLDKENPDASLRSRPLCGLEVVQGLHLTSDGSWDKGKIYDPEEGKTYDLAARLAAADRLDMTGYAGSKLLSETLHWRRAPTSLPRCK